VHYLEPYHNIKQDIKLQMSMVVTLGIRDFTRSAKEEDFPSMYSIMIIMLLCSFVGRHEFLFFEIMQTAGLLGSFFFEEI
jgi:hypothetical protein